ncbi:hypothetical protein COT97_01620 [Candidatus Falkowbacteria bacterium CG10_big_fil_rev_8_21_14_0_10_39_11]|uniref:Uncharacterized protein n=1 Tax=Candidatus Falkowbacteria bacterium CG10_big_fil_rev_8_21_14_0_10_39_11 TaxID=1974565 RepID=A0A2H0V5J6_9BACT|nr:MAG: hypothetical protein COT97_01620 [Candidatus Falkowbacteria bacterium CG10_big_fil_rev_8_21_14_0_10_39_11]
MTEQIKIYIDFDIAGHEGQYVFSLDGISEVPFELCHKFGDQLGFGWTVEHKGTSLEIFHEKQGYRDDNFIYNCLSKVIGEDFVLAG